MWLRDKKTVQKTVFLKKKAQIFGSYKKSQYFCIALQEKAIHMVLIVQLVRASDCGSECRGFESH